MQNFNELNLSEPIRRAISELGFETPSAIQAQALPLLLGERTDFLGLAATGTGKTAAFAIPLLERMDPNERGVQALILCPTRELAQQVSGQIDLIGKYLNIHSLPIYGGAGYGDQIRGLKRGVPIVVGTPGRVVDHMNKGTLDLSSISTLILDEADEMISMGFKDDLEAVLSAVPQGQADTWLFSATMSGEVRRVADTYLNNPHEVRVNQGGEMVPSTVEQIYYATQESNKPEVLCKLIDAADDFYGIVFCQTKALVMDLTQYLVGRGYRTDCLHGDMEQAARERTMKAFRDRKFRILIATDVACRGLDVKDITHVVNYSLPRELDNYVHRIGRTGRSGKTGLAFNLVTPSHRGLITRIERMTKTRMTEGRIPTRKDIGIKKVASSLAAFEGLESHARVLEVLDESWKKALSGMSKEEIASRFLGLMLPEVFAERAEAEEVRSKGIFPKPKRDRKDPIMTSERSERSSSYERRPKPRYMDRGDREERSTFIPRPRTEGGGDAYYTPGGSDPGGEERMSRSYGKGKREFAGKSEFRGFAKPRREEGFERRESRGFGGGFGKPKFGGGKPKGSWDRPLARSK
jgi:ATP-dependent RNA helicase DeaD